MNPQSGRPTLSLDGEWRLRLLASGDDHLVTVPGPWTTQIPGKEESHETVQYRRRFDLPSDRALTDPYFLLFGGVNYAAVVTLNGHRLGEHIGGWTPFEFAIGDALRSGENELTVDVSYPPQLASDDKRPIAEIPHGKQSWYGTTAGIWQSVTIERRPEQHVRSITVRADAATRRIEAAAVLARPAITAELLTLTVTTEPGESAADTGSNEVLAITELTLEPGTTDVVVGATVEGARLWSPDDPQRYRVSVTVQSSGARDTVHRTTGFRTIKTRDGEILLNGEPIEIRAVLDQDYHPGSSTIPESDEALEALFREARRLGFNTLRCHIKRPDHRYYDLADRMGLLVWTELPSWLTMTAEAARDGARLLAELIELDGHHPSIVIWTVINESWGIDLRDAGQRAWLRSTFEEAKRLAPHSLIVDNSACEPHFHVKSDLDDYHVYRGIPEGRLAWDVTIAEFASRPDWTFSPYGDAERTGTEPLLLSEYGNWGLPIARNQYVDGAEPWWFANGAKWASGAAEGTGLLSRFHDLGLDRVFGSWEGLVDALQRAQMVANRYQTGEIRSHAAISGYVLTQLSDVQWEANGLFDMTRQPKAYNDDFALVNGPVAVVLRPECYSAVSGSPITVGVTVVSPRPLGGWHGTVGELRLLIDGEPAARESVAFDARAHTRYHLTSRTRSGEMEVAAELWFDGALLARDAATVVVVDDTVPPLTRGVCAADAEVAEWLAALGIEARATGAPALDEVLVTRRFEASAQEHARAGGRALVLVEDGDALGDAFDYLPKAALGPRDGDGDWVPRQEWLRRDGAFGALPGGPLLGIAYEELLGELVINGIPAAMRPAEVHSAIFSGWLRHAASTTITIAWSDGEVTITTFRVRAQAGEALGRALGRALVAHGMRA